MNEFNVVREIHWSEAEKLAGERLDRRRCYGVMNGEVMVLTQQVASCSGCTEIGDYGSGSQNYPTHEKHHCLIGAGCDECGYHGIRRFGWWMNLMSWQTMERDEREHREYAQAARVSDRNGQ